MASEILNTTEPLPKEERSARPSQRPFLFVVLHCDRPTLGGARYDLSEIEVITIGRGATREASRVDEDGSRKLTLSLPSPTVSKAHARLVRRNDEWFLEDLGSKNGCCINGQRVERTRVQDGDFLEVGSVVLRYRAAQAQPDSPIDLDSATHTPKAPGYASLVPSYATELDALARVARLPFTTLLLGETGTGKEVLANGMHLLSGRVGPFVAVNCGALPASLLESQLFGHVRGSFTGARRDEPGFIRSADGGTLFLDEIGDLPLPAQAALLRALQQREVVPVGGARPTSVDVRFIAATNKSLDELCLRGEFRADLLARLATYQHRLPLLRDRIEDLGILMSDILRRSSAAGAADARLSVSAARRMLSYPWPHNIRQLEGVLEVAVALADGGVVERLDLPEAIVESSTRSEPPRSPDELREHLISLLREHRGNATTVARRMGKSRTQIYRWMQELGIDPNDYRA